ncbi:hypothetical protein LJC18_04815 [Lachnospiraceae bacterium OttesenSCG-928-E19]|nr:hypothetical protein [Lachnospiraceae bacterium OttesenSCG-928-E19]
MMTILQDIYNKSPEAWTEFWNTDLITSRNNCYSYAVCNPWTYLNLGEIMNPGFGKNPNTCNKKQTIKDFMNALKSDGLTHVPTKDIRDIPILKSQEQYLTSIFVTLEDRINPIETEKEWNDFFNEKPYSQRIVKHYHIIRQHADGSWSERNGAEGKVSKTELFYNYKYPVVSAIDKCPAFFLGYFKVPTSGLDFGIPKQLNILHQKNYTNKRLKSHQEIVNYLYNFSRLSSDQDSISTKKQTLDYIIRRYPEIISNFVEILKKDSGGWQNDIFNSLEYANKPFLHKVRDKFIRKY